MFSVESERSGRIHRLRPTGELDLATVPILKDEFDAILGNSAAEMIVIDLTDLSFIDAAGVRLLLQMNEACEQAARLRIVNGSPIVERCSTSQAYATTFRSSTAARTPLCPCRRERADNADSGRLCARVLSRPLRLVGPFTRLVIRERLRGVDVT
jgi:anti-anti-sigma factor